MAGLRAAFDVADNAIAELGYVYARDGAPLPPMQTLGSVVECNAFQDAHAFLDNGGQKGVQRPVLPPGTLVPIHPVAFLVLTPGQVYGIPVSPELASLRGKNGALTPMSFGLTAEALRVVVISPEGPVDMIGIVTVLEGEPLPRIRCPMPPYGARPRSPSGAMRRTARSVTRPSS